MTLYKFDLQEHYNQFRDFLIQSLPTTASLVGWLICTGFYESDPVGKCNIWTSHADPFQCDNPVVWIFDSDHRIRIFMASEATLDLGEFTKEALELADCEEYKDKVLPTYFVDPQLEKMYNKSKEILGSAVKEYMNENKKDGEFVLLHGVNVLWSPVLQQVLDVVSNAPCYKFVKPVSSFDAEKSIVLPDNLKMSTLEKKDVQIVHSTNKIAYDIRYVEDCFRISSAIRRTDNNELAAWSMSHRDLFVGSLHVLPDYRRKGCAEIILQDLCKQYAAFFKQRLPDNTSELYFGSAVESFNDSSANLFRKTGWRTVGLGITWIYCSKKKQ